MVESYETASDVTSGATAAAATAAVDAVSAVPWTVNDDEYEEFASAPSGVDSPTLFTY